MFSTVIKIPNTNYIHYFRKSDDDQNSKSSFIHDFSRMSHNISKKIMIIKIPNTNYTHWLHVFDDGPLEPFEAMLGDDNALHGQNEHIGHGLPEILWADALAGVPGELLGRGIEPRLGNPLLNAEDRVVRAGRITINVIILIMMKKINEKDKCHNTNNDEKDKWKG